MRRNFKLLNYEPLFNAKKLATFPGNESENCTFTTSKTAACYFLILFTCDTRTGGVFVIILQ